jgi:hypothetical protein
MNEPSATAEPPLLDIAQLTRYEELLLEQGTPLEEWSNPGLSEVEMAELVAPLPFALSAEARVWWGWRDGTNPARRGWTFGPGRNCLPLARAVEQYEISCQLAKELASEPGLSGPRSDPDFMWRPGWLPILDDGQLKTVLDCEVPEGKPSPVVFIDIVDQPEEYASEKMRSFGEMIGWWCLALEAGIWRWDQEQLRWHTDYKRLPEELGGSPFV